MLEGKRKEEVSLHLCLLGCIMLHLQWHPQMKVPMIKQRHLPEVVEADGGVRQLLGFCHQFVQKVVQLPLSVVDGSAVDL